MYEFAIVVLLGVGTFKLVDMIDEHVSLAKLHSLITMALGVAIAWGLGFSLFEQWNLPVRSEILGYVGTGVMIAAAGYALPQVFEHVAEVIGRRKTAPPVSRAA